MGVKRATPVEAQEGARGARSCRAGLGGSRRTAAQVEVTRGRRAGRGGGERSGLCVTGEKEGVSGISGYPGGLGVYTWSGGSPRCCMRTPWDLWGQCRAGGRCFPGSAGLSVQEAVKPVTGGDRGAVETGLCFAEAPEFLSGERSRCQGPGGSGLRMVGAGKVRIGDVGQKRCETRGNAKAPAWLSAEPQTEGVWTGSVTQKTPSPHPSCLTLTHTWCYLWRPQILPRPAERQLAASLPKSCPSQAWKPSDLTKLHGLPTNQQGDVPPPPSRNQAWRFMLERLPDVLHSLMQTVTTVSPL